MLPVGELQDKSAVNEIRRFFEKNNIPHQILKNEKDFYSIYVDNEADLDRSFDFYCALLNIPSQRKIDPEWEAIFNIKLGQCTILMIALSIVGHIVASRLQNKWFLEIFLFSDSSKPLFYNIMQGEVWRLITPIFLHFNFFHVAFNCLWLKDLGKLIENYKGKFFLICFIIVVGILSNIFQYLMTGPSFGGMSGVVYGFLGYIWIIQIFIIDTKIRLPKRDMWMMIGWCCLCAVGIIPLVANVAHATGLVTGGIIAMIDIIKSEANYSLKKILLYSGFLFLFLLSIVLMDYWRNNGAYFLSISF